MSFQIKLRSKGVGRLGLNWTSCMGTFVLVFFLLFFFSPIFFSCRGGCCLAAKFQKCFVDYDTSFIFRSALSWVDTAWIFIAGRITPLRQQSLSTLKSLIHMPSVSKDKTGMISSPLHGDNWNTKNYTRGPTIFTGWLEGEAGLWVANINTLSGESRHASSGIINRISSILQPSTSYFHSFTVHLDQRFTTLVMGWELVIWDLRNIWVSGFFKEFAKTQ